MADTNVSASFGVAGDSIQFVAYDEEFTATPGSVTVPSTKFWIVQNVAVLQGDATARAVRMYITNGSDVEYGSLSPEGTYLVATTLAQNAIVSWRGKQFLPPGWKVNASVPSLAAGTCKMRVLAIELSLNWDPKDFLKVL